MINDSFRILLNDQPAKLFRSGTFTVMNVLMMNGYTYQDMMGKSGQNLVVQLNGRRKVFYGEKAEPCVLKLNGEEAQLSDLVQAGDRIEFVPVRHGTDASAVLSQLFELEKGRKVTINGKTVKEDVSLKNGDVIFAEGIPGEPLPAEKEITPEHGTRGKTPKKRGPKPKTLGEPQTEPKKRGRPSGKKRSTAEALAERQKPHQLEETEESGSQRSGTVAEPVIAKLIQQPELDPESMTGYPEEAAVEEMKAASISERREPTFVSKLPESISVSEKTESISAPRESESLFEPEGTESVVVQKEIESLTVPKRPGTVFHPEQRQQESIVSRPEIRPPVGNAVETAEKSTFHLETSKPVSSPETSDPVFRPEVRYLPESTASVASGRKLMLYLNDKPLVLPPKPEGTPYYLMDMLEYSGLDLEQLTAPVILEINGESGAFQQELKQGDAVRIYEQKQW